jgi:hypothetical protein
VSWQGVLNWIDAVESWIVAQSFWVQVVLLLVVLGPLSWFLAGLIDRGVEWLLRHLLRDHPAEGSADPLGTVAAIGSRDVSGSVR